MVRASEQSDAGNKLHTSQLQHIHIMTLLRSLISQRPLIGEREQRAFLKLPATDIGGEMIALPRCEEGGRGVDASEEQVSCSPLREMSIKAL